MKIVVLIPMHNFAELTDRCVELVRERAGIEHKILVVDDASDAPYEPKFADVSVIRLKQNGGFTKAVNTGLRFLRLNYDYVHLLNNDTEPEPDFLKNAVDRAQSDPAIGIVGSGRISEREPYTVAMWGRDLTTGLVACSHEDETEPSQCIWIPFCSVLLSRACVETVGLLDEKMRNHCSDNDYCLRTVFMGLGVVFEPTSKVFHHQSVTVKADGLLEEKLYQDQKTFIAKWFGPAMNEILEAIPVNEELGQYGQVGFKQTKRKAEIVPA